MIRPTGTESSRLLRESAKGSLGSVVALGVGLLLDLTLAFLLGAGARTDALYVALRIPLGVAVFFPATAAQILVPAISRWLGESNIRRTNSQTSAVLLATFVLTGLLAIVCILFAPQLVRVLAPGLPPEVQALAADLARIAFLMIPPAAASQVLLAYRHAHRMHGLASAAQAAIGLTVVSFLLASNGQADVQLVVSAYALGAVCQLTLAWLLARGSGYSFVPSRLLTPETRLVGARSIRPLVASAVQLGTRIVELMVASFLAPGSITILTYANRLIGAVGGTLFFKPVMTAFIAPMSREHALGNTDALNSLLRRGLRLMLLVSVPLTAVVAVGGSAFIAGVFAAGSFSAEQAQILGIAIAVYATSLPSAALQRMLLGFTFAQLDTATYLRNTIYGAVSNLVLLGAAMVLWQPPLPLLMVPIAFSLSQIVNAWHAASIVRRYVGEALAVLQGLTWRSMLLVVAALATMIPIRLWLAPDLTGPPSSLIVGGLATSLVGALALGAGALIAGNGAQFIRDPRD
jgi:putative peptidoglycan lipid II flippase